MTSLGIVWRDVNGEWIGIGDETYVIEHVVGLPAPHVCRCPPLVHLAGNYGIEFDSRRAPSWWVVRRSVSRRGENGTVHSPLGSTACPPLLSPIANHWSDMWFVDELVRWGGYGPVSSRSGEKEM